jgi:cobalamin biosynthesis Mg chelatase CobN
MKAWIYICAIVLVAGRVMVLAEEPKTNTAPGTAIPSPATSTPTNPAPAQPKITTVPRTPNAVTPSETGGHKGALTNPPTASTFAPAVTNEARSPDETSLTPTSAVPAEAVSTTPLPPTNATPPSESSGISNLAALAVGLVILVLAIGLAFFMWRRSHAFPHGSLITSAMNELKHSGKNEDKDEEKHEEKQEETPIETPAEKKPEKKFPPPMT